MKKLFLLILTTLFISTAFSQQSPKGMNYQAVARDLNGKVLANEKIDLIITLQSDLRTGKVEYQETHSVTTNDLGLFSLVIGEGDKRLGAMSRVPWSTNDIFMKVSLKDHSMSNFKEISNSRLLAVPYAFHAITAEKITSPRVGTRNTEDGVPSNTWSTFGNSKTDSTKDKLGTTDAADLVIITNNVERMRIEEGGDISIANNLSIGDNLDIANDLQVGNDLNVEQDVSLNNTGGNTTVNGNLTVANMSNTILTGNLNVNKDSDLDGNFNVDGNSTLVGTLNVDGTTTLNDDLAVTGMSNTLLTGNLNVNKNTDLDGTLNVDGATDINDDLSVTGMSNTLLTGNLNVNKNTDLDGDLNVDGTTAFNGDLDVGGASTLNTLTVEGNSDLQGTLDVTLNTTLNENLTVNGDTDLDGTLNADGASTLNSTLDVSGATVLANTLNVQGNADLDSDLNVDGNSSLVGTLGVTGATSLNANLTVGGASDLNGTLDVQNLATFQSGIDISGEIGASSAKIEGPAIYTVDSRDFLAHFKNTDGSGNGTNGIAVQIGTNSDYKNSGANDYVTFFNGKGEATGSIEGFSIGSDDPLSTFPGVSFGSFYNAGSFENFFSPASANWQRMFDFNKPDLLGISVSSTFSVDWDFDRGSLDITGSEFFGGSFNPVNFFTMNPITGVDADNALKDLICWALANGLESLITTNPFDLILAASIIQQTQICKDNNGKGGVTYVSYGADYAEWLPRLDVNEGMKNGMIVGVINGKITRITEGADQILAISTNPIVLGNEPLPGKESEFEKVAFMGQVPVLVRGKVAIGDYILPSGRDDGFGKAVHPDDLKIEDLTNIVGRAWSASQNDWMGYVNVAIGLNRNDVAQIVMRQQNDLDELRSEMAEMKTSIQQQIMALSAQIGNDKASFENTKLSEE